MRTLSATTDTEVAKKFTRPILLVQVSFATVYRWSTNGNQTWNSQSWSANGVRVESLRDLPGGGQEGEISIPNQDAAASALVLSNTLTDVACSIWMVYGSGPHALADAVQLFSGVLDGAPDINLDRVRIGLVSEGRAMESSPRLFLAPPLCNHMPPRGSVLTWGGERYTLEGGNG